MTLIGCPFLTVIIVIIVIGVSFPCRLLTRNPTEIICSLIFTLLEANVSYL